MIWTSKTNTISHFARLDCLYGTLESCAMLPESVQAVDSRTGYLTLMPPELVIKIFCQLSSFSDAFALSTTSHRFQHIWLSNVDIIYCHVAPRSIACESEARDFLAVQDGPALNSPMSAKDVLRIIQNARVVDKAIRQFEREIVSRVRSKFRQMTDDL